MWIKTFQKRENYDCLNIRYLLDILMLLCLAIPISKNSSKYKEEFASHWIFWKKEIQALLLLFTKENLRRDIEVKRKKAEHT